MSERVVKADEQSRLYIQVDNRRWYAPAGTNAVCGETVTQYKSYHAAKEARTVNPPWSSPKKWAYELWETTDPPPPPKKKVGLTEIRKMIGGANILVSIKDGDGNPKRTRRTPSKSADLYFAANSGMNLTWAEWDALVDEIDAVRADGFRRVRQSDLEIEAEVERIRQRYQVS